MPVIIAENTIYHDAERPLEGHPADHPGGTGGPAPGATEARPGIFPPGGRGAACAPRPRGDRSGAASDGDAVDSDRKDAQ